MLGIKGRRGVLLGFLTSLLAQLVHAHLGDAHDGIFIDEALE